MKQIKLLCISCAILLCTGNAFAQSEEKKPSKEETIKWLTEKITENERDFFIVGDDGDGMLHRLILISVSEYELVFDLHCTYHASAGKIKRCVYKVNDFLGFSDRLSLIGLPDCSGLKFVNGCEWDFGIFIPLQLMTPAMGQRFCKAIKHLQTFCDEGEPF